MWSRDHTHHRKIGHNKNEGLLHLVSDESIRHAIAGGERNAEGFTLVRNWCAHVRIERFGGRGMVEAVTGLPIGHHCLACDHAPASGMASWDIRDAALNFYDRNCHNCTLRKVVGVPQPGKLGRRTRRRSRETASGSGRRGQTDRSKAGRTTGGARGTALRPSAGGCRCRRSDRGPGSPAEAGIDGTLGPNRPAGA